MKNDFPDISLSLKQMDIMLQLERYVDDKTLFGFAIKKGFVDKQPYKEIIQMIVDQIRVNRQNVAKCIPNRILKDIEQYFIPDPDDLKNVNI